MPIDRPEAHIKHDNSPAGGFGALRGSLRAFQQQGIPLKVIESFAKANKPGQFDCPGCAFPDKGHGLVDSCEQGQKAIAWEMTPRLADADFFSAHPLQELRNWTDYELENQGRLAVPLLYDSASDTYQPIPWESAFTLVGETLQQVAPERAAFYASGRSSNEAAFLWQLMARAYGSANLPDSSNLCHEPSGFALKESIGVGKGTCTLDDFEHAELIMVMGHNPASNHPRMMAALDAAARRGATVIAINPLAERGFINFTDPKELMHTALGQGRAVAKKIYQVKIGGDLALLKGVMKSLVEMQAAGRDVLDWPFINAHSAGFAALHEDLQDESWDRIVTKSGLPKSQIEEIAELYAQSNATMATWCMGITQHEDSVATIQTIINLLLLRGNIGKPGAGAVPVRGHSNVQGERTMGCTFNVSAKWIDNLESTFPGVTLSRAVGYDAAGVVDGLLNRSIDAFLSLGGNFAVAVPDSPRVCAALSETQLTVHIVTKFNRGHCYPGNIGLVLPCLARTDIDSRGGNAQIVTVEDSMSRVHSSRGIQLPRSPHMLSEPAIVAGIGHRLCGSAHINWETLANDYALIREKIELCQQHVFDGFADHNRNINKPNGVHLPNAAAGRVWNTASGKAMFKAHPIRLDGPVERAQARTTEPHRVLSLMTLRSHDQFNTTVYGLDDRYRGVFGGRHVIFVSVVDLARLGFKDGDWLDIHSCTDDGVERAVYGFRAVAYDLPQGCAAAYFPEAQPLAPSGLRSRHTRTPAYKEIPVMLAHARVAKAGGNARGMLAGNEINQNTISLD